MLGQLVRFVGVGGLATLAHIATAMSAQALLPLTAQGANLAGYLAGFLVSYTGHARVTFGAQMRDLPQLGRFFLLSLLGLGASSLTVHVVTGLLGLGFPVAMVAVGLIVPGVTYLAMRFWVFDGRERATSPLLADAALAGTIAVALLLLFWDRLVNHDIGWYLFATRDWLAGARLYLDLVEVNPPLNFYLTLPSLLLADTLGISDQNGHYLAMSLLYAGSLFWAGALLRRDYGFAQGRRALVLAGFALAVTLPALNGYGQREHIMALCFLPWALGEAAPRPGRPLGRLAAAVFAAVGMCLKPHFVVMPLAVTLFRCMQERSLRPVVSMANLVFLAAGLAYIGYVRLVHPAYLAEIVPAALEVYGAYSAPLREVLLKSGVFVSLLPLLVLMSLFRDSCTRPVGVFLALSAGGFAAYLLQGTGFAYHRIPLLGFAATASLFLLLSASRSRAVGIVAASVALAVAATGVRQGFYRNPVVEEVAAVTRDMGRIDGVLTISSYVHAGPPVAMTLGTEWVARYPTQWLVPGAVNRLSGMDCSAAPDTCARLEAIIARNRGDIIADITRSRPDLLIVDRRKGYADSPEFDWLAIMAADPGWTQVLADYRKVAETPALTYFLRNR